MRLALALASGFVVAAVALSCDGKIDAAAPDGLADAGPGGDAQPPRDSGFDECVGAEYDQALAAHATLCP